jgi:hypothetical protein
MGEGGSWYVDRNHGVLPVCMVAWFHWTVQEKTTITIISNQHLTEMHCKKELAIFPSPAGMSLTKLSLGGKKL